MTTSKDAKDANAAKDSMAASLGGVDQSTRIATAIERCADALTLIAVVLVERRDNEQETADLKQFGRVETGLGDLVAWFADVQAELVDKGWLKE